MNEQLPAERPEPEAANVGLAVGVDKVAGSVVLDLSVTGGERPIKVRMCFTEEEVGRLCTTLLRAVAEVRQARAIQSFRAPLVIPQRAGAIAPIPFPKRSG